MGELVGLTGQVNGRDGCRSYAFLDPTVREQLSGARDSSERRLLSTGGDLAFVRFSHDLESMRDKIQSSPQRDVLVVPITTSLSQAA